ncbi:MAG: hypothetical protein AAF090_18875 [Bacteroidota bacterium]
MNPITDVLQKGKSSSIEFISIQADIQTTNLFFEITSQKGISQTATLDP